MENNKILKDLIESMQDDIDMLVDGQEVIHGRIEAKVEDIDARLMAVEIA